MSKGGEKVSRKQAGRLMEAVIDKLASLVSAYELCGSYRRGKPECGDGDVVVLVPNTLNWRLVAARLTLDPYTKAGDLRKRLTVIDPGTGFKIELYRAGSALEFSSMVLTYTGSYEFNVRCRGVAKRKGMLLNQYGLFSLKTGFPVALGEREILEAIGLGWIEPGDRE